VFVRSRSAQESVYAYGAEARVGTRTAAVAGGERPRLLKRYAQAAGGDVVIARSRTEIEDQQFKGAATHPPRRARHKPFRNVREKEEGYTPWS